MTHYRSRTRSRLGLLFTSEEHYQEVMMHNTNAYLDSASEAQIQDAIKSYLLMRGWAVLELSQPNAVKGGLVGGPDLIAWRFDDAAGMSICILIETKTRRGKLRKSQEEFYTRILPHLSSTLFHIVPHSIDEAMNFINEVTK